LLTTSHLLSRPGRYCGHRHHRPVQSWFGRRRSSSSRLGGDALRRPAQPVRGRAYHAGASSQSPINTERPLPRPDTGPAL